MTEPRPDADGTDLTWFEHATSIVQAWEACYLNRLLTSGEVGPLVAAIARELQAAARRPDTAADRDWLREAAAIVDAWSRARPGWRLRADQATSLAESIAASLRSASVEAREH